MAAEELVEKSTGTASHIEDTLPRRHVAPPERLLGRGREIAGPAAVVARGEAAVLRAYFGPFQVIVPFPGELGVSYWTALIMSKIGRYIATIIPPTTTPSTTIMIGSIAARSASTAASTSSS